MNDELRKKVINWLKTFPKHLKTIMKKFCKGESNFHLIRLVSRKETIQLWISEYPQRGLDILREELSNIEYMYGLKEHSGLDDDDEELEEYKNDDAELISGGFLEYMIIENEHDVLPSTLFDVMKDKFRVGDIVYAPYYESRMYYGIHLACLNNKHEIILKEEEGWRPNVKFWQKRIMDYNELSFKESLIHIEEEYGDWDPGCLIEMWE